MDRFLNRKIYVECILGGIDGSSRSYKGILTSVDDEFLCLDNKIYIEKKFIMAITVL